MPNISFNAKLYQERREPGYRVTLRGPGPQVNLPDNKTCHLPLEAPLPLPALLAETNGRPPTDTGRTKVWPHGDAYAP